MIRFFKKLFKRGDFMTRADKAHYKYRAKTIFWSAFCLIIIAWVGTNLVLCALTTNVESNFDISFAPARDVDLPTGSTLHSIITKNTESTEQLSAIKTITFDYIGGESSAAVVGVEPEVINEDDKIYLYRANNGADLYILSPNHMHLRNGEHTFASLHGLKTINFKNFKYDPVSSNSMMEMFCNCSELESFDFSGWDTSLTYSFEGLFGGCSKLETLKGIENLDTSNVTSMNSMFGECSKLSSLDLSGWDTSKLELMDGTFYSCSSLTSLDLTGWDTSNVFDMGYMFMDCTALPSLDLTAWDTYNVEYMNNMFANCYSLKTIYASDSFVTDSVEDATDMFLNCNSLTGGNGTKYPYFENDIDGAKIDDRWQKGYFTEK